MRTLRVVQWATGSTGSLALGALLDDPRYEVVGVRVYAPEKVGKDIGELIGRSPVGIVSVGSRSDVIDLAPDVVLYMGRVERSPQECIEDVVALLGSGINVITTGSTFIDPRTWGEKTSGPLEAAAWLGGATFLGLGLFPGFWGEVLAPSLSRLSLRATTITIRESLSYASYASSSLLFDVMGYGHLPDSTTPVLSNPKLAGRAFTGTATVVAKALGLTVDRIEPFREVATATTEITTAAGTVKPGTVGAMKLGVSATCGSTSIRVEHVTWMDPSVTPEWARREGYEIEFDGAPTLRCNLVLGTQGEDHAEMGCLATAMHAVNAIPTVHAASSGLLDLADAPGFAGAVR